jgi:hypothetical protein
MEAVITCGTKLSSCEGTSPFRYGMEATWLGLGIGHGGDLVRVRDTVRDSVRVRVRVGVGVRVRAWRRPG